MPKSCDLITLAEAAKIFPGHPHRNTLIRWCMRGYSGVILASWKCGNRRVTTAKAIDEFIASTSKVDDPNPRRNSSSHQIAEARLDAAGI